jgi:uncharacterized protein (DUF58 family)
VTGRAGPIAVGLGLLAAGWAFGSVPLALAGLGVVTAGVAAAGWARLARGIVVTRDLDETVLREGDALRYRVTAHRARLLPGTIAICDLVGPVAAPAARISRRSGGVVALPSLPRGVYHVGPGRLTIDDPLGLAHVETQGPLGPMLRVRPRFAPLETTFVDGGRAGAGGRRRPLALAGGTEPHGVREYREGESLRAVHWASSARKGRLMVREMEEPPRDDAVILVDLDAGGVAGPPGASSLDEAVRVAASLVHAQIVRGRRVGLVLAAERPLRLAVGSGGGALDDVLDALAGASAAVGSCTAALLRSGSRETRDGSLVLVTTRPAAAFADALLLRGAAAVVSVDAPTYAGAPVSGVDPALLRLAAHGVPVAVVRCGDELAHVLSASRPAARA